MADRIKYLHKNSANSGTERLSESNSTDSHQQSESNTRISPRKGSVLASYVTESSIFTGGLGDLLNLATSDEDQNSSEQTDLFDYDSEDPEKDEDNLSEKSVEEGADDNSPPGDDDQDGDSDPTEDEPNEGKDAESDTAEARTQTTHPVNYNDQAASETLSTTPQSEYLPKATTKEALVNARRPSEMVDGPLVARIYYRTSDEQNKDARMTIDQQRPLVQAAVSAFDVEVYGEPIKDKAISGERFDREGLEQIEEDAKEGNINVVIVSDIDRLGRVCEKTIEFVKRLRYEYGVYVIANVRWYDVSDGDDLETFNAKAGRAEAENKKRGGRGNRGKLFKLFEHGSDAYLSWFQKVPVGYEESDADKGIKLAEDARRQVPRIVLEEFMDLEADKHEYAKTKKKVEQRLDSEFDRNFDLDLNIKRILTNPVYTGRAVIEINEAETHSVDQAEIGIDMPDLRLYDSEEIELWEDAQEKVQQITQRNRDKTESRPEKLVTKYGPEMVDDIVASWTLICPKCESISEYEYHGRTTDKDGTKRQKCKCNGNDEPHYFRVPTRDELEKLENRDLDRDTDSSD